MFSIVAPSAKEVRFASDLFGWDRPKAMQRSGDQWVLDVPLPDDVRIEYQFVVDGKWILDPKNPVRSANGFGGFNSSYTGPQYTEHVPDTIPETPMRRLALRVGGHAESRAVALFVPEGVKGRIPVLIYADGKEYEKFVQPQHIIQNLIDAKKIPPVAVALVPPKDRMQEYWKDSTDYEDYVVHNVLPALREQAPISMSASDVYVGGASLGGLISMRLAEHYPAHVAGGVHSQSGAFWASPGVFAKSALLRLSPDIKIFIDWGRYEGVLTVSNDRMADALRRLFKPHGTLVTGEGHNWTAWRSRFATGLEYLLGQ
ncbi:MAG: hypothetical protein JNK63_00410 [Chthonomonas sp.]|nr:hypothetical protein [Chthonomonas sp.]